MKDKLIDQLIAGVFYVLPHHLISRLMLHASRVEARWFSRPLIAWFHRQFGISMADALDPNLESYPTLNAFFTRALRADARPLPTDPAVAVSPVDGVLSEFGRIDGNRLLQAKGFYYDLDKLLGGRADLAAPFRGGSFATVYLSPRDYHRVHMPFGGELTHMIYVSGRLFSVSLRTTRTTPEIFTRNERVIALFDTDYGRMAVVLVGAINVAAIETVWAGLVTPPPGEAMRVETYDPPLRLERGMEMGRFNLGSTVVVLFEAGHVEPLPELLSGMSVKVGQALFAPPPG